MHPHQVCKWQRTGSRSWYTRWFIHFSEGPGQAAETGSQEPHAVQQGKAQSPAPGEDSFTHKNMLGAAQLENSLAEQDLEVLVDKMNMLTMDPCSKMSNSILGFIKNCTASRLRELILPFYSAGEAVSGLLRAILAFPTQ